MDITDVSQMASGPGRSCIFTLFMQCQSHPPFNDPDFALTSRWKGGKCMNALGNCAADAPIQFTSVQFNSNQKQAKGCSVVCEIRTATAGVK